MANRRKTYLVNPSFQLKFSVLITFLIFLSSLIYPFAIFDLMNEFIAMLTKIAPSFADILIDRKKSLWIILVLWEIGFLGVVFTISIFFSHKVAGPIHRIKDYLNDLKNGKPRKEIILRKGDYFQDFTKELTETFEFFASEYNKDFNHLTEIINQLNNLKSQYPEEKREPIERILEKVMEIQYKLKRK